MLGFQKSAGEESGLELNLAVTLQKGGLTLSGSCGSWGSLTQGKNRKVPSKTTVLVRIRFSGCNKGSHIGEADRSLHLSPALSRADGPGLVQQVCFRKLLSSMPHHPWGVTSSTQARAQLQLQSSCSQQQDRGRSRRKGLLPSPGK